MSGLNLTGTGLTLVNPGNTPASSIAIGIPVLGGTVFGMLWEDAAGNLASGPVLTDTTGNIKVPAAAALSALNYQGINASGVNVAATGASLTGSLSTGTATNPNLVFNVGVKTTTGSTLATGTPALTLTGETLAAVFAGIISAPAGSASLPSLTFSPDVTSGLYQRTTGVVTFATGGAIRAELSSTGLRINNTGVYGMSSGAASAAADVAISRVSAGVVGIGTGASASVAGSLQALNFTLGSGGALQLGNAYVAGTVVQTGTVTMKDSSGTTVRVLVANP